MMLKQWTYVELGSIVDLINGRGFKSSEWRNEGIPIIRISNLNGDPKFNYYDGDYDDKHFIGRNDLLFSWSGNRGTSFGPHIWKGPEGLLNQHIFKLYIKESALIKKEFLYYSLLRLTIIIANSAHGGSGLVHVKKSDLIKFKLPLPKMIEQQKIATILSSVDEAIEKTEQIIKQTETVKKGLMQQLLTKGIGHTRFKKTLLGEIPESWEVSTIQSHLLESKSGASLKSNEFSDSGIKVLPKKAVNPNGIFNASDLDIAYTSEEIADKYSNSFVNKSYLVTVLRDLVPSGPNIGRIIKIIDEDSYLIAQGVYGFRIDSRLNSDFLIYLSNSEYFRDEMVKKKVGSTQVHLRSTEFFNTEIPLPPIDEQIKLSRILSSYDSKIRNRRKKISYLSNVKQGLMQDLLTGKVRVPIDDEEVVES